MYQPVQDSAWAENRGHSAVTQCLCHVDGAVAATRWQNHPTRGAPLTPHTRHHSGQASDITVL